MHLLIVDDDPDTVDGLAELLVGAGFECETALTFQAAKDAMRTSPPDVLVADIRLAAYNGLHLVLSRPRRTTAIVMSACADPVLESAAVRMGASFIAKPVETRQLLELLNRTARRDRSDLEHQIDSGGDAASAPRSSDS